MAIEGQLCNDGSRPDATVLSRAYVLVTVGMLMLVLIHAVESMSARTVMPVAAASLGGVTYYAWGFSGYLAASLPGMAVAGTLCDRYGPRPPYLASAVLFGGSLLMAGTSTTFSVFVIARIVQGFSAGLYIVTVYVVIGRVYPKRLQPRMFSLMPVSWAVAAMLGPQLAAWVAHAWSWRAVYLAVPPLIFAAAIIVAPALGGRLTSTRSEESTEHRMPLLAVLMTTAGVWALQFGGQEITVVSAFVLPAAGALLIVAVPKLLPPGALRFPPGGAGLIALRGVLAGGFSAAITFLPLMLVRERGLSVSAAGTVLTAVALAWAAGAWHQGRPHKRDSHRRILEVGCLLAFVGVAGQPLALLSVVPAHLSIVSAGIGGLGMGLAIPAISVLLFERTPPDEHGHSASQLQLADSLGSVSSVALAGCLFAAAHNYPGHGGVAFIMIYLMAAVLAAGATVLSRRVLRSSTSLPE